MAVSSCRAYATIPAHSRVRFSTCSTIPSGSAAAFRSPFANIGAMRLPDDLDDAVAVVRHAIDAGMRYIDTCRRYGESEVKLGEALKDGYREKVILSSKWAPWVINAETHRGDHRRFNAPAPGGSRWSACRSITWTFTRCGTSTAASITRRRWRRAGCWKACCRRRRRG